MRKLKIKRLLAWFIGSLLFLVLTLIILLTVPSILYANHTSFGSITVYHQKEIPSHFATSIEEAISTVKVSPLYQSDLRINVCLNDGSKYPSIVKTILGDDVFTAFANNVVLIATDIGEGKLSHWGQTLSYTQFLSHGLLHNYQFDHHGLFGANPLGGHPNWKWEGYVEYELISKNKTYQTLLKKYNNAGGEFDWVGLNQGKSTIKRHLQYAIAVKYCLEEKKWGYDQLMDTDISLESIEAELALKIELQEE
ncbi:hypothetical protein [Roseivirga sp.]|uniref:hypothetical protein n=1 Tax=Roseivirga sp. TaxID=1964215 RepID=UPI003B8B6E9B